MNLCQESKVFEEIEVEDTKSSETLRANPARINSNQVVTNAAFLFAKEDNDGGLFNKRNRTAGDQLNLCKFQREIVIDQIVSILKKSRPNAPPNIVKQIPSLASRIEATLYVNAKSRAEYSNRFTLETRMKEIALNTMSLRSKRQRQTPRNSSCDLVKLHNDQRKRAMLNRFDSDSQSSVEGNNDPGIVACVTIGGAKQIAFNFSSSKSPDMTQAHSSRSTQEVPQDGGSQILMDEFEKEDLEDSDFCDDEEEEEDDDDDDDAGMDDRFEDNSSYSSFSESENELRELVEQANGKAFRMSEEKNNSIALKARISQVYKLLEDILVAQPVLEATNCDRKLAEARALCQSNGFNDPTAKQKLAEAFSHSFHRYLEIRSAALSAIEASSKPASESINTNGMELESSDPRFGTQESWLRSQDSKLSESIINGTFLFSDCMLSTSDSSAPLNDIDQPGEDEIPDREAESQPIQPVSLIVGLCAEIFATPSIDYRLLRSVLSLWTQPALEDVTSLSDRQIMSEAIEKFVSADPKRIAPFVVRRLIRSWPRTYSERQVIFLMLVETVLQHADDNTILELFTVVLKRVASCTSHGNWHVANCALSFSEKLIIFAEPFVKSGNQAVQSLTNLDQSLAVASLSHWHASVRSRSAKIRRRLGALID